MALAGTPNRKPGRARRRRAHHSSIHAWWGPHPQRERALIYPLAGQTPENAGPRSLALSLREDLSGRVPTGRRPAPRRGRRPFFAHTMSAGISTVQETPRHKGALRLRSGNKFDVLNSLAAGDKGPGTASRRGRAAEGGRSAGAQRPGAQRRAEEAASAHRWVGTLSGSLASPPRPTSLSLPRAPQRGWECSQTPPLATEPEQRLLQPSHTWKSSEIFPLSNWECLLTPS